MPSILYGKSGQTSIVEMCETPPVCIDCKHYEYDGGSWCRKSEIEGFNIINIITGKKLLLARSNRDSCQNQRYSEEEDHCGIEGRFFEPK